MHLLIKGEINCTKANDTYPQTCYYLRNMDKEESDVVLPLFNYQSNNREITKTSITVDKGVS